MELSTRLFQKKLITTSLASILPYSTVPFRRWWRRRCRCGRTSCDTRAPVGNNINMNIANYVEVQHHRRQERSFDLLDSRFNNYTSSFSSWEHQFDVGSIQFNPTNKPEVFTFHLQVSSSKIVCNPIGRCILKILIDCELVNLGCRKFNSKLELQCLFHNGKTKIGIYPTNHVFHNFYQSALENRTSIFWGMCL